MNKVVIKILQGSVVTQTVLGGLTRPIVLQLQIFYCVCAKNYESWYRQYDKVINDNEQLTLLGHPVRNFN